MPCRNKMCCRRCRLNVVAFLFCEVVIINFPCNLLAIKIRQAVLAIDKEFRLRLTYNKAQSPSVSFKPNIESFCRSNSPYSTIEQDQSIQKYILFTVILWPGQDLSYNAIHIFCMFKSSLFNLRKELDNIFMVQ